MTQMIMEKPAILGGPAAIPDLEIFRVCEAGWARFIGVPHALSSPNGTMALQAAIHPRTKAIVVVHYSGTFGDGAAFSMLTFKSFPIGEGGMLRIANLHIWKRGVAILPLPAPHDRPDIAEVEAHGRDSAAREFAGCRGQRQAHLGGSAFPSRRTGSDHALC